MSTSHSSAQHIEPQRPLEMHPSDLDVPTSRGYASRMSGPSSKAKPARGEPVYVPHPDDAADVREAFDAIERGEVMSVEESAAYLRSLLGEDEPPSK